MTQTFEEYVDEWDATCAQIAAITKQLKPLKDKEMVMRRALEQSVREHLGADWREGVNKLTLADGRVLKVTHSVKRTVEAGELPAARELYARLNDAPVSFDDLLRVKYELDKRNFDKLEGEAAKVFSRVLVAKDEAPKVELS